MGRVGVAFGFVDSGVCTGIQHPVGLVVLHRITAGLGIRQIQFPSAGGDQFNSRWR